jgi:tetratricopeptide (TPR) repeat protein
MRLDVLVTLAAVALAAPFLASAASFDRSAPPPPPSALQEMLDRPGVADALGPIAIAELREATVALGRGDFRASASFAERVTRSAPDVAVGWHILGLARANAGDFEAALDALDRASGIYRNNGTVDVVRGDILTLLERPDAARDAYTTGLDKDPDLWPALIGLGDLAQAQGDTDGALAQFRRALAIAPPRTPEPIERVAQTLLRAGDGAAADSFLADIAAQTDDPDTWRRAARLRIVNGDTSGASDALAAARALAPDDRAVLEASAELARAMGRPADAAAFLSTALEQAPADPDLAADLARVQIEAGDPAAALATLEPWSGEETAAPEPVVAALAVSNAAAGNLDTAAAFHATRTERFPSPESYADRATFLAAREDLAGALAVLDDAVAAFPDMARLRLQQGRVLAATRDYEAALAALDAGLALAPGDRALLRTASAAARRLGDLELAQSRAAEAVAAPDADADDRVWLGIVAAENGDEPAAIAAYRAALDTDADNVVALNNLAVLVSESMPAAAISLARRAVDLAGAQPALMDTLGWALFHDGALSEARAAFEASLDDRPDSAMTRYKLGRTLAALGDGDAARAAFSEALETDPGFAEAEDAQARLEGQ